MVAPVGAAIAEWLQDWRPRPKKGVLAGSIPVVRRVPFPPVDSVAEILATKPQRPKGYCTTLVLFWTWPEPSFGTKLYTGSSSCNCTESFCHYDRSNSSKWINKKKSNPKNKIPKSLFSCIPVKKTIRHLRGCGKSGAQVVLPVSRSSDGKRSLAVGKNNRTVIRKFVPLTADRRPSLPTRTGLIWRLKLTMSVAVNV